MERIDKHRLEGLSRFASRVLLRTRSGSGVAVYLLPDGSCTFLCRPTAIAVTRTLAHNVSYESKCKTCGTTVVTCTVENHSRLSTPCLCTDPFETRLLVNEAAEIFSAPEANEDEFFNAVLAEVTRHMPFVLFGMVKGFVHTYWPMMGKHPDPVQWAAFFLHGASGQDEPNEMDGSGSEEFSEKT